MAALKNAAALEEQGGLMLFLAERAYAQLLAEHEDSPIGDECLQGLIRVTSDLRIINRERYPPDLAIGYSEQLVRRLPQSPAAHGTLAQRYQWVGRTDEALQEYRAALDLDPTLIAATVGVAECYLSLGDADAAETSYQQALRMPIRGDLDVMDRAITLLSLGQYAEGWEAMRGHYRGRRMPPWLRPVAATCPEWDGTPLSGRLLIYHIGGYGDAFMMLRWLPQVRGRVGSVVLATSHGMVDFWTAQCPDVEVREWWQDGPVDAWTQSFALPAVFKIGTPDEVPSAPYIRSTQPSTRLDGAFKVGLVWAGSPAHDEDLLRSTSLADWAPVLQVLGCDFYSLQLGKRATELEGFPQVHELRDSLSDWSATAAVLSELDLLISVDSAVANLAGAMGRPVWICLAAKPDFRWLLRRTDSPWYPSARLFRQDRAGDWSGVFDKVAASLEQLVRDRSRLSA